ncbi:hypothetical protein [Candidatus Williamhamiltonella defendens]|uniref:hypothetical protein n=1 Tax=Candidatus Williamhamiltonella defendens TaxID=138072 RepID=UPI00130E8583|nr:hypothetical protein [Candidatus Hamiltonella defensa]
MDILSTLKQNNPVTISASLVIYPSTYGVQQEYTSYYSRLKYIRKITGDGTVMTHGVTGFRLVISLPAGIPIFMRGLLKISVDAWKWIEKAPLVKVRKSVSLRIRWFTQDEVSTLIKGMPESFRNIVIFAMDTGLRSSNIIDLEYSQVDMRRMVA